MSRLFIYDENMTDERAKITVQSWKQFRQVRPEILDWIAV